MNFLSHFYFTKSIDNPYYSLGGILPDLFRNHHESWKFNPEKQFISFKENSDLAFLYSGWKLHLEVDMLFHNSAPFKLHTSLLRKELANVFLTLPKRPFFLAHVGYELILDSLLIRNKLVDTSLFYQKLAAVDSDILDTFMDKLGIIGSQSFHPFLDNFVESRYLESYNKTESLIYALDRIGQRVWIEKFSEREAKEAKLVFDKALDDLNSIFLDVFKLLEKEINQSGGHF